MERSYANQQLKKPVVIGDLLTGDSIATIQTPFFLTEADFLHLRGSAPLMAIWATNLFFVVVGYAVSLGPKFLASLRGEPSQVASTEWMTIVVGILASLALYGIGRWMPNERKKLMKRISEHFRNAPASHHVIGRAK